MGERRRLSSNPEDTNNGGGTKASAVTTNSLPITVKAISKTETKVEVDGNIAPGLSALVSKGLDLEFSKTDYLRKGEMKCTFDSQPVNRLHGGKYAILI